MSERDDERRTAESRDLEQDLSALLDGELAPARERAVRQALEGDVELRERFAAFESVDAQLRELDAPAMPQDLRTRLEARIASDSDARTHHDRSEPSESDSIASWNWRLPLAAALAAALFAGWLALPRDGEEVDVAKQEPGTIPPAIDTPSTVTETPAVEEASDLELAIAFELETLRDLEVIEELELLEALLTLEEREREADGRSTS